MLGKDCFPLFMVGNMEVALKFTLERALAQPMGVWKIEISVMFIVIVRGELSVD
jgi:hypothetical protein